MKITTRIVVTAVRANGDAITLDRAITSTHGDNPSFERNETKDAVRAASEEFISAMALGGTRPL